MTGVIAIRPATAADLAAITSLLEAAQLPTAGVADAFTAGFVAQRGAGIVGAAALECYADGALLRSVVVHPAVQDQGVGRALALAALDDARRRGMPAAYLLTTTAASFFARMGFNAVPRDAVPASVRQSIEFASACPATATAMVLHL